MRMRWDDGDKKDNPAKKGFDLSEVLQTMVWTPVEKGDLVWPEEEGKWHEKPVEGIMLNGLQFPKMEVYKMKPRWLLLEIATDFEKEVI